MAVLQDQLRTDLMALGIEAPGPISHNPDYDTLFAAELDGKLSGYERGVLTQMGAVNVNTGIFTGRSPKDKYIVMDANTEKSFWWPSASYPNDNHPLSPAVWRDLKQVASSQLSAKPLYVIDAYCGAAESARMPVRFVMEVAWQAHFVKNMFIRPSAEELESFRPEFTVLNASKAVNPHWREQGLHSENFVAFNFTEKMQLIGGTWYGGEMKKGLFSVMNYLLPLRGMASMHASANVGKTGDVAIFFGLSGTGKTTLSADPGRALLGDDELGWDDSGVFNLEGGCYAKTLGLDPDKEPDIYRAIRRDALLENVVVDTDGAIDFNDGSRTQNTRVSYPIYHIDNIVKPVSCAGHADKIIFLTADAFGVFPPVSLLTDEQAQYHFLSGFTSKVAGTELGVDEPSPTFSACFGEAFLSLHPTEYARQLVAKMHRHNTRAYLVNTGWNGEGKRISLAHTRRIIDAICNDEVAANTCQTLPFFNLRFPSKLAGVPDSILDPRSSHSSEKEWQIRARNLAQRFRDNFAKFTDTEQGRALADAGPVVD